MNVISEWDIAILDWMSEHLSNPFLDTVFSLVSFLSEIGWFWIVVAITCMCFSKTRKAGVCMGLALLMGTLLANGLLKPIVGRIRPWEYLALYHPEHGSISFPNLAIVPTDGSFPSGHTIASVEAAVALFLMNKKMGVPALIISALTAFGRLYLYIHYPTDVLAAIILGIGIAFLSRFLVNKYWDIASKKVMDFYRK